MGKDILSIYTIEDLNCNIYKQIAIFKLSPVLNRMYKWLRRHRNNDQLSNFFKILD